MDHPFVEHINPVVGQLLSCLDLDKRYVKANGCYLYDEKGNKYLDMLAGYGSIPFGFNPKQIWDAIHEVEERSEPIFAIPSYLEAAGELAKRLTDLCCPGFMKYVTFVNSGTEAAEAAIKLARSKTGRLGILSTWNGFHGKTLGALSATGKPQYQQLFGAPVPNFDFVPFGDSDALDSQFKTQSDANQQYAAFIIEPIQGEGGVRVPPSGYLKKVRDLCTKYDVIMIIDEVQTGMGRTGSFLACQYPGEEVVPDIIMLAKALGGGVVPIGAIVFRESCFNDYYGYKHSSTFAGNALASRVGLKVLELLQQDNNELIKYVDHLGSNFSESLRNIKLEFPKLVKETRGRGFLLGIEFWCPRNRIGSPYYFLGLMAEQELLAGTISSYLLNVKKIRAAVTLSSSNTLRIEPPLIATKEMCDELIEAMRNILLSISQKGTGQLFAHLLGSYSSKTDIENQSTQDEQVDQNMKTTPKVAFIVNPSTPNHYASLDTSFKYFDDSQTSKLADKMSFLLEPFQIASGTFSSPNSTIFAEQTPSVFLFLPRTNDQLATLDSTTIEAETSAIIELALSLNVEYIAVDASNEILLATSCLKTMKGLSPNLQVVFDSSTANWINAFNFQLWNFYQPL